MSDAGSPLFGSSKSRSGTGFSFLRGRRTGDTDGLISFNLMPQETRRTRRAYLAAFPRRDFCSWNIGAATSARLLPPSPRLLMSRMPAIGSHRICRRRACS